MAQSNMYSQLTDYQRTSGPVSTTLLVLSLWDNQTCTVTSLITRGPVVGPVRATLLQHWWFYYCGTIKNLQSWWSVVLLKQLCWFCHCETIKHVLSPHWLPEDQLSCKSNIVGLFLWHNQTYTVTSLITREPVVLIKQLCRFCHCETIKHVQ